MSAPKSAATSPVAGSPAERAWFVTAVVLYLGFAWLIGGDAWSRDATRFAAVNVTEFERLDDGRFAEKSLLEADHRFVVWLAGRNAWTWLHRPGSMFDAEPCHPAKRTLARGEPGFTLGLLGIPVWIVSGEPVFTFNFVAWLIFAIAPLAMFWLVWSWTGVPAAALLAGLVYGFAYTKIGDPIHPYGYDTAWGVLALVFARRMIEAGRWRDTLALVVCCGLQIGSSFYPLLAVSMLALPFGLWLVAGAELDRRRWLQVGLVAASILLISLLAFWPFLDLQAAGEFEARLRRHLQWTDLAPAADGWPGFPGFMLLALAAVGLLIGKPAKGRDPRWVLLAGSLAALALALSHRLYTALAGIAPGLGIVRNPVGLALAVQLGLCILAGYGVAGILRRLPSGRANLVGAGLVAMTGFELLFPGLLGLAPRPEYAAFEMKPRAETIAFYAELEAAGNDGPLLEIPMPQRNMRRMTEAVLMSAWHHRKTSACYNSYLPDELKRVEQLTADLSKPGALAELRRLGFTTLVVHHDSEGSRGYARSIEAYARGAGRRWLRKLATSPDLTAYQIRAPDAANRS